MRRSIRTRAAAVLGAVIMAGAALAGCGEDPATPGAGDPSAAGAAFPVSIAHKYGTTEIKTEPKRVVVVGLTEQDALLALGVVPVATTEWFGGHPGALWPWAKAKLGTGA